MITIRVYRQELKQTTKFEMEVDDVFLVRFGHRLRAGVVTPDEWYEMVTEIYRIAKENESASGDHSGTARNGEDDHLAGAGGVRAIEGSTS